MKTFLIFLIVIFVGLFSGVGIASFGGPLPASSGTLVLFGSGLVGLALWGRRKFRR
jgi:hypothetical protein